MRSLGRGVKIIIGGVIALGFRTFVRVIARVIAGFAAVRMHTLNRRHIRQQTTFSCMAFDIQEQPRNRVLIERVDMGDCFARDFAAVFQLPGRPGDVLSDDFVLAIF